MDDLELRNIRLAEGPKYSEKPIVFGERGEFWTRYDRIADAHDKDMLERLHSNLDVLLIFAGLFSAVNTAFIVVTLANLSSNPSDETNTLLRLLVSHADNSTLLPNDTNQSLTVANAAIRQNCTFFASLCSSLLAATGAVLAKQWLVTYDRTGQTGSLETQSLRRTEKFLGAEAWGLQPVVEFLPTLLLISLALFFVALVDFLWTVSLPVALVVLVFFAFGAFSYGFTVVAAAIDPKCPFQTSVSSRLRQTWLTLVPLAQKASRKAFVQLRPLHRRIRSWSLSTKRAISQTSVWVQVAQQLERRGLMRSPPPSPPTYAQSSDDPSMALQKEVLYAKSISWMLEVANEDADLRSIAENIPTISHHREAIRTLARSTSFPRLAIQYRNAMTALQRIDNVNSRGRVDTEQETTTALVFARAVGHVFSSDPKWCYGVMWRIVNFIWPDASGEESESRRELYLIHDALQRLCGRFRIVNKSAEVRRAGTALRSSTRVQFSSPIDEKVNSTVPITPPGALSHATAVLLSALLTLSGSIDLHDYGIADSDVSFTLSAIAIRQEITIQLGEVRDWDQFVDDVWMARAGRTMRAEMDKTLRAHEHYITATDGNDRYLLRSHSNVLSRFSHCTPPLDRPIDLTPVAPPIPEARLKQSAELSALGLPLQPEGVLENPIKSLAELISSRSPDDYVPNIFVTGLHSLSLLFEDLVAASPNTLSPSLLQPGRQSRQRLSPRSLVDFKDELRRYALQLLIGYISGGLVADHNHGLWWARPDSLVLAHALVTLEIGRHLTLDVFELRHFISALGIIAVNVPGGLGVLTPQHLLVHPSVSPALVTALSLSDEADAPLVEGTWELLNYVASTIGVGSTAPLVVIGAKLGSAIIRSFCRLVTDVDEDERTDIERRDILSYSHILKWLADSLRQDPTLAVGFKEAGAGSLFSYAVQACIQSLGDGDDGSWTVDDAEGSIITGRSTIEGMTDMDGYGPAMPRRVNLLVGETWDWPWDIALLFVGLLHLGTIQADHTQCPRLDPLAHAPTPNPGSRGVIPVTMSDMEWETLVGYMRGFMCRVSEADLVLDLVQILFQETFSVIEQAFLRDPRTALAVKLDEACDLVIQYVDTSCHSGTYAPWWVGAHRAYRHAGLVLDDLGTGWWRFGGLGRACSTSSHTML
ncbi:hypothetical protein FRB98_001346 [Tulasnella sp. 332]|nr:hypothetical protein FRB98_001346 [Tulasnella sp. 332]